MALKIGKREKLVVGSMAGLGFILVMHLFIFSKKINNFVEVKGRWESLKNEYANMGNVQNPKEIQQYKTQTTQYIEEFNKTINDLNFNVPPYHGDPEKPENEIQVYQETYNFVNKLKEMAQGTQMIKYSFLGKDGWNFPMKLPDQITNKRVNLGDLLEKIKDVQEILRVISQDNFTILTEKKQELKNLKKDIGVDVDLIDQMNKYGSDIPRFLLIAHSDLIMAAKSEDYPLTKNQLYTYLDITMPKYVIALSKQMDGTIDIMERAKKAGIEEIKDLYFLAESKIFVNKTTGETAGQQEAVAPGAATAGGPGAAGGMPAGMMGAEGGLGEPGIGAEGAAGLGNIPGMEGAPAGAAGIAGEPGMMGGEMGFGTAPAAGGQQQKKQLGAIDTLISIARPIKIKVSGPNLNVINFLYDISHCKKTYEIDDLYFQATQEGRVDCTVTINILTWVDKMNPVAVQ